MHTPHPELSVTLLNQKNILYEKFRRRSNNYFIFIFQEASGEHVMGEHRQPLENKSIHFVAQGISQVFDNIKKMKGYCIEFSPDLFSRFTLNKEVLYDLPFFGYDIDNPSYKVPADAFDFIYALFSFMYTEMREKKTGHERVVISSISIVLLKCGQWFRLKNRKKNDAHYVSAYYGSLQLVENYRKLIREHFTRQHFVKFYAARLNQTPNYLNVVVKNITGLKASDLIHQQLILEAKYMLIHTKLSHKEVAAELGFADQSYFTKFFKRETGQRPLDWFRSNK